MKSEVRIKKMHVTYKILIIMGILLLSSSSRAAESICPGGSNPNPNVVFCEDFDDGSMTDGKPNTWDLDRTYHPNHGAYAVSCAGTPIGGAGYGGGCAFWSDYLNRSEGSQLDANYAWGNNAWFAESDVYVRYYFKKSDGIGASWAQKGLTLGGDIGAQISSDYYAMGKLALHSYDVGANGGLEFTLQNQGNDLAVIPNRWYLVEIHAKLNTSGQSNGVFELWMDDASQGAPASQTLRTRLTNVNWGANSESKFRRINLLTNYQNSSSTRLDQYVWYDQIVVSKSRIGAMGGSVPTPGAIVPKSPQIISIN